LIIDRHLARQVAMPCCLVSIVLLSIFVGYSLSRFLNQADAGLLNTGEVVHLTALKVLIALEVLLPIGLYFGLMLGLGLLIAYLSIHVRPWAYTQTYSMLAVAEASSDIDRIKAGQFYITRTDDQSTELDGLNAQVQERAIFIEEISLEQDLSHVFIRTRVGDELKIVSAQSGLLVEQHDAPNSKLELDNARIFKRVEDGPDLVARIEHFTMNIANEKPEPPAYKAKAVASAVLQSSENPKDRAEYQWRISTPLTTLLLALLAIPLSRSRPRHGRYAKLLLAFVIYAAYYNMIGISQTWVEQQKMSSIWWAPAVLAFLVVLFYLPWHSLKAVLATRKK